MPEETPEFQISPESAQPPTLSSDVKTAHASTLWGWQDLASFLLFGLASFVLSYLLVGVGYMVWKSFVGGPFDAAAVQHDTVFALAWQTVLYALLLGFLYFLVAVHHRQPFWSSFKLRKLTKRQTLGYVAGGFLVALGVQILSNLLPKEGQFPLERMFTSPGVALALGVFATLVAPFVEELIFRGLLFAVFERQIGLRFAIAATAVLFAAPHIPEYWGAWSHVFLVFVAGTVFSLARGLTGALTPSIVLHFAYNLSLMTGLFFATQHFRTLGLIIHH